MVLLSVRSVSVFTLSKLFIFEAVSSFETNLYMVMLSNLNDVKSYEYNTTYIFGD